MSTSEVARGAFQFWGQGKDFTAETMDGFEFRVAYSAAPRSTLHDFHPCVSAPLRLCVKTILTPKLKYTPRRLLVAVWYVLTEQAADRHAVPEKVAFKLMIWAWKLTDEQRGGLPSRQFVRYGLLRLRLGDDLTHIITGKATKRPIAPAAEVMALCPDLAVLG